MSPSKPESSQEPGELSAGARWRLLGVLLAAMFMSLVSVSIVNVVLPSIGSTLQASEADMQWVLAGYALTFGVVLVAAGRAGDLLGRGVMFVAGVAIFTAASVSAGLAADPMLLNIARFIMGVGSGLLNPQVMGMIQQHFRGAARGRAYGLLGTVVGFSVAVGPVLGGLLINWLGADAGWRSTFLINVPVGILAIVLAVLWLPKPLFTKPAGKLDLDPVGGIVLALSIFALLLPFVQGRENPVLWWLLAAAVILLAVWVLWEKKYKERGREPMVELALFKIRSFTNGTLIAGLYFMGVSSVWVLVAIYVQASQGFTALEAGLICLPAALLSAFSSHIAGRYATTLGRKLVIGGTLSALFGLLATIAVVFFEDRLGLNVWWMLLSLAFIGIAQGFIISPNQALTLMEVPVANSGSAGGLMQTSQRVGTAVGIAVITAVFYGLNHVAGYSVAMELSFVAISLLVVATLLVAIADMRHGHGKQPVSTREEYVPVTTGVQRTVTGAIDVVGPKEPSQPVDSQP
ncbi:MFS transporter [Glutamicibacter mishrai]|uniref:MFS transporter n=1 Tax=Glutamicibacter mishrai TaxID=1775880 RepID=UPI0020CD791C|nr:MFS transporter [Glutamicibacter mishrai]UTT41004.1 MFS transporter [Glutamicibacter mishrai]